MSETYNPWVWGLWEGVDGEEAWLALWEVSEEAKQKVREDNKKIKSAQKQKKEQHKRDKKNAWLITLVLKHVDDPIILKEVVKQLTVLNVDWVVVVAQLLPYIQTKTSIESVHELYDSIWDKLMQANSPEWLTVYYEAVMLLVQSIQGLEGSYGVIKGRVEALLFPQK